MVSNLKWCSIIEIEPKFFCVINLKKNKLGKYFLNKSTKSSFKISNMHKSGSCTRFAPIFNPTAPKNF